MTQVIYDSAINVTNCYTAVNRDQRKNINNKNLELEIMRKIEIYKFQRFHTVLPLGISAPIPPGGQVIIESFKLFYFWGVLTYKIKILQIL